MHFAARGQARPSAGSPATSFASTQALPGGVPRGYVLPGIRFSGTLQTFETNFTAKTGYKLDPFQREGIRVLQAGKSPVVCAPTSSGKTLVAEAAIQDAIASGKRLFYTTPRKAISNEKYHEFVEKYGKDNVGLVTGDVSVNPDAPLVLMTTEIFRNQLYQPELNQASLSQLKYVVFDECHFINDDERGPVWEESAMYARRELPKVQQIHLSATVQNSQQYTDWLNSMNSAGTRAGNFELITSDKRPVPLSTQYLAPDGRLIDILGPDGMPTAAFSKAFAHTTRQRKQQKQRKQTQEHHQSTLIGFDPVFTVKMLAKHRRLPLIEFVNSRDRCNRYAEQVLDAELGLTTQAEKQSVAEVIQAYVETYPTLKSSKLLPYLPEGVAYHHADMWPREKELVEVLLKKGLMKAVFATTTLAEGVNVPAQSVGLSAYKAGNEEISESAYQQMTGRAGRRGMYERGYSILSHPDDNQEETILRLVQSEANPVKSQFKITPYMALNQIQRLQDPGRINALLESGFKAYQAKAEGAPSLDGLTRKRRRRAVAQIAKKSSPLKQEFNDMRRFLQATGFVREDSKLTPLGKLAAVIPMESSLMVAKAAASGMLDNLAPAELAAVLSATVSDEESPQQAHPGSDISESSAFPMVGKALAGLDGIMQDLLGKADYIGVQPDMMIGAAYVDTVARWCLTHNANLLEAAPGVLTYTVLRTANLLEHISEAPTLSQTLKNNAKAARKLLLAGKIAEQIRPRKVEIGHGLG